MVGTQKTMAYIPDRLVEYITEQELEPGERLPSIRHLSRTLKVGPNVVRDGLLQLQTMGVVNVHPRAGTFVKAINYGAMVNTFKKALQVSLCLSRNDDNLVSLVETRCLLETEAAQKAALRHTKRDLFPLYQALKAMDDCKDQETFISADERFHLSIARCSGNNVFAAILEGLLMTLRPYRATFMRTSSEIKSIQEIHMRIYQSILDGDVSGAQEAISTHLNYQLSRLLKKVSNPSSNPSGEFIS